jgi:TRAP-type C4-dicarboxylate transport system substrate-binding protein
VRLVWLACFTIATVAPVNQRRLRLAAAAPVGTEWAGQLQTFAREVGRETHGRLEIKWTLGGTAGDEATVLGRMLHDEMDGLAGAVMCERLAPSLRVLQLIGVVDSREKAARLLDHLHPRIEEEIRNTPFDLLFVSTGFGHRLLFSKKPVRTLEDFKRGRWWVWSDNDLLAAQLRAMGAGVVPLPLDQAVRAADEGRIDGFFSVPGAALAFDLYTRAHYFTDLSSSYLPGCMVMNAHTWGELSESERHAVRSSAARLKRDFEATGQSLDEMLGDQFTKAGLTNVPMSASFRAAFFASARAAADQLADKVIPRSLLEETRTAVNKSR